MSIKDLEYDRDIVIKKTECIWDAKSFFDGDIIITDPCYLNNGLNNTCDFDIWNLEEIGISNYMMRDTIYGDWFCALFDVSNEKINKDSTILGYFCADSGMVIVADMEEVRKYNPKLEDKVKNSHLATIIYNFKGLVKYDVRQEQFEYNGNLYTDYYLVVSGEGINKKTGKTIKFESRQIGF